MKQTTEQKTYKLMGANGEIYESTAVPGLLGGNSKTKVYGKLTCKSAINAIPEGYEQIRVFFADEATAIAAGYRPCHTCMYRRWQQWAKGPQDGEEYPWKVNPVPKGN